MESYQKPPKNSHVCSVHLKLSTPKNGNEKEDIKIAVRKYEPRSKTEDENFKSEDKTFNILEKNYHTVSDKTTKENLNKLSKLENQPMNLEDSNIKMSKLNIKDAFESQPSSLLGVSEKSLLASQSSITDISCSLQEPVKDQKVYKTDLNSLQNHDTNKETYLKPNSISSHSYSYKQSSEELQNEVETEIKPLKSYCSVHANQSIYQLAFDDNDLPKELIPLDPETEIPKSLTNSEIVIHEIDSDSEAGSEDVELIPHRYESEAYLNDNKHMYVNKLSLAVELLRTREKLPYDKEFKRVENISSDSLEEKFNLQTHCLKNIENKDIQTYFSGISTQQQAAQHSDFSDVRFDYIDDHVCKTIFEEGAQEYEIQNTEEKRAGYRRFVTQARNYVYPRAALPINPCFCCSMM